MGGGGKGGGSVVIGYKYFLGMHLVLCHGPVDFVGPIYAGERQFAGGRGSSGIINANAENLFGGEKKEGGIVGKIDVMFGEDTQGENVYLRTQMFRVPGYRSVVSLVANKCYVCAMSPYPKPWAAQVTRIPGKDWYPETATINPVGNASSANGAHIIRETIMNTDWGLGYPFTAIDDTSFRAAALTLYTEGLGLSLILAGQGSVEEFLQQILRHINGVLYVDRYTGKFVLKLTRDDYVIANLPVFDISNIKELVSFQRPTYGEMINEVVIVYRPRGSFSDSAITAQDLASVQAQGGVVSQTMQYPGIDSSANAGMVAMRELKQNSTPLAKARIIANREAWSLNPGDVFKLSWAPKGINQLILRAMSIDYGGVLNGMIEINAVEDIFGVPDSSYITPQDSIWTEPIDDPVPVPESKLLEVSYWDLVITLSPADFDYVEDTDCFLSYQARVPSIASPNFGLWTKPAGATAFTRVSQGPYAPTALLAQDLGKTQETGILISTSTFILETVELGTYGYIDNEIVRIDAIDPIAGTMSIGRGCLDSVPAAHVNTTRIWFIESNGAVDPNTYVPAEILEARATTITGIGELDVNAATTQSITFAGRHFKPYPPGQYRFNSVYYPVAIVGALVLAWVHRDRTIQTVRPIIDHFDGTIGPEVGTTYTMSFFGERDLITTALRTVAALSGNTRTWTEELADSGLWAYAPVDTHSFLLPLDTNARVEGPDQTVELASNVTDVSFDGDWAQFAGTSYMDVEDIDIGETFSLVFGIDGGSYPGTAVEGTIVDKSSSAGANIFSLTLYSGYFRSFIGAGGGTSFATWGSSLARDHYFLVTVEKNQPSAGQTRTSIHMDGVLLGQTSVAFVVGAMAGKPWSVGAGWSGVSTRDKFLTARLHRLAFFKGLLTLADVWPEQRLNDTIRATLRSVRDATNSWQTCDHQSERAGFGYRYG